MIRAAAEVRDRRGVVAQDLCCLHPDRDDRHPRTQREIRGARLQRLDLRPVLTRAFGEHAQDFARLEHRDRVPHRFAVGAVAQHGEPAQPREQRAEHRDSEQRRLAHEPDATRSGDRRQRDVHHRPV
jgi:hypothetical protein